ncbi:MAG: NnrS family protein, partial [Sneathiella sp.]
MQKRGNGLLFESGFRIFFLSAALYAALTMALWSAQMSGALAILEKMIQMPLPLWHAHELLFGFIVAVVAGFLTTAVPVWTGSPRIRGVELKLLFALWLAGRIAIFSSGFIPIWLVALVDIAFLPAVAFSVAKLIIPKKLWKNLGFVPLLLLIATGNALFYADLIGWTEDTALTGIQLSIGLLILMTVVIGGRVVPFFTSNWLKKQGRPADTSAPSWIAPATILSCLITIIAGAFPLNELVLGALNYLTGALILFRLAHWQGLKTLSDPIMWVLHLGYALMGLGFIAEGLAFTTDLIPELLAQHVFTIGGLGVMVLGMMSRIALGHTGRPLDIKPAITLAYFLILLSLLSRVIPPLMLPDFYELGLAVAGASWIVA